MRQKFHRCLPEWDLSNLCIFTGLDMYDLQDMYDLPEWSLCCLNDLYILTGIRSERFAGSVRSAGVLSERSGGSVEVGYFTLVSACLATTGGTR